MKLEKFLGKKLQKKTPLRTQQKGNKDRKSFHAVGVVNYVPDDICQMSG